MNENNIRGSLELRDIWMNYRNGNGILNALSNVNYSFEEGSFTILHGPSGSGKSTLIRVMGLIEIPTLGSVRINGTDTSNFTENQRNSCIKNNIGFIFGGSNLIDTINALENVILPMISQDTTIAKKLLKKVGFTDYKKFPKELSLEEKLKICIARSMINNHSIILADEPTADLHSEEAERIMTLLKKLNKNENLTMVIAHTNYRTAKFEGNLVEIIDGTI